MRQPRASPFSPPKIAFRSADKVALFVGIEAYEQAGGMIMCDLFSDANATFLTDRPLLVKLATEKLAFSRSKVGSGS